MKKTLFGAALAACLSAGMVMGTFAGEMTAEEVFQNYIETSGTVEQVSSHVDAKIDAQLSVPDAQMTLGGNGSMEMDVAAVMDPLTMKAVGTMSGQMMDQGGEANMEMYMVPDEDGSLKMYVGVDMGEGMEYGVSTIEPEVMEQIKGMMGNADMFADLPISFELADGTVEVNGTECYELVSTLGIEDIINIVNAAVEKAGDVIPEGTMPDEETMAMVTSLLSGLKLNVAMDVDAESYLPIRLYMDMAGSDWVTLGAMIGGMMGLTNEDGSLMSISLDVNDLYLEYLYDYSTPVTVEIPQEVIDSATDMGSAADLAGSAAEMVGEVESEF